MNNEQIITKTESNGLYILKAFAIIFAMSAHVVPYYLKTSGEVVRILTGIWQVLCRAGVPVFLIISAFFYKRDKKDTLKFWKKKFFSLILPWFIAGGLNTCYVYFGQNITENFFVYALKFIFGYGSYFYFLTVLTFFFIVFKFIPKNLFVLLSLIVLTIVSLYLESIYKNPFTNLINNQYLNPFNWIGFFALGILVRKYRLDRKLIKHFWIILIAIGLFALGFYFFFKFEKSTYFHLYALFYEIPAVVIFFYLSYLLGKCKAFIPLTFVGKWSFTMYMYHMMICQQICFKLPSYVTPYCPFIALGVMCLLIIIPYVICKKMRLNFYLDLFGLR